MPTTNSQVIFSLVRSASCSASSTVGTGVAVLVGGFVLMEFAGDGVGLSVRFVVAVTTTVGIGVATVDAVLAVGVGIMGGAISSFVSDTRVSSSERVVGAVEVD